MCRTKISSKFKLKVDTKIKEEAKEAFPDEFEEMTKKLEELKIEDAKTIKVKVEYGNKHKLVPSPSKSRSKPSVSNKHEWTVFVRVANEGIKTENIVEKVKFELHETFRNPTRIIENAPFQLTTKGWGTFEIQITITWKKSLKYPDTVLYHDLSFEGAGEWKNYTLRIHEDLIKPKTSASKVKVKAVKPAPFK
mmetsp:Transcript_9612/g.9395  ORF Transcript_9612/g.9395 Transcript_9612/m.9395 type:complete len:193 (-) Transcript_9612:10-588(-)